MSYYPTMMSPLRMRQVNVVPKGYEGIRRTVYVQSKKEIHFTLYSWREVKLPFAASNQMLTYHCAGCGKINRKSARVAFGTPYHFTESTMFSKNSKDTKLYHKGVCSKCKKFYEKINGR